MSLYLGLMCFSASELILVLYIYTFVPECSGTKGVAWFRDSCATLA
jgi:hypothetical protein